MPDMPAINKYLGLVVTAFQLPRVLFIIDDAMKLLRNIPNKISKGGMLSKYTTQHAESNQINNAN